MDETVATVTAWQEAANRQDADELLAVSAAEIRILGPRGVALGHDVLRAWLEHAGLTLTTRSLYARGGTVVAEQRGVWRSPDTGATAGEADLATWFQVTDGKVTHLARYDHLADALAAAGLTEGDRYLEPATKP